MKSTNFKKAVSFFAIASAFSMAGCQKDELMEQTSTAPIAPAASSKAIAGKYIVIMKDGQAASKEEIKSRLFKRLGITRDRVSNVFEGASDGFSGNLSPEEVQQLRADEDVAFVEQEQAVMLGKPARVEKTKSTTTTTTTSPTTTTTSPTTTTTTTTTTSPTTTTTSPTTTTTTSPTTTTSTTSTQTIPWGVARVGYGDGTGKTVWVIDSGVQSNHPDLNVDKVRSKSFISGDASYEDGYGHGTAVAGIIGAKNNNEGIVGVAANATIVALRVFDNTGYGTLTRIYSALNYAYTNGQAGDVINMSLRVSASTMLDDLVRKAAAKGMFVVVAAGNSAIDCKNDSPARVVATNVHVVSNMDSFGKWNPSSNFGASVNRSAPGTNIRMTWKGSGYATGNGTSYAAPHVAGILALNGGKVNAQGLVAGDPDGKPDPIALK